MTHGDRNGFPSRRQAWNGNAKWKDGALCTTAGYNSKAGPEITRAQSVCCVWVHLCTRPWWEFSLALVLKTARSSQAWILSGIKVWKWVLRRGCCKGSDALVPRKLDSDPHATASQYVHTITLSFCNPRKRTDCLLPCLFILSAPKGKAISPWSPLKPTVWW